MTLRAFLYKICTYAVVAVFAPQPCLQIRSRYHWLLLTFRELATHTDNWFVHDLKPLIQSSLIKIGAFVEANEWVSC